MGGGGGKNMFLWMYYKSIAPDHMITDLYTGTYRTNHLEIIIIIFYFVLEVQHKTT